jgi:hypothetical protein
MKARCALARDFPMPLDRLASFPPLQMLLLRASDKEGARFLKYHSLLTCDFRAIY